LVLRHPDRADPRRPRRARHADAAHPGRRRRVAAVGGGVVLRDRAGGSRVSDWALPAFVVVVVAVAGGLRWYERSRPTSRTLALVATLAALATIARVAFAPIPNVKPTTDIVLLAGFALGPAPGFAVGAFAGLTSNFIFGHGPWTPW